MASILDKAWSPYVLPAWVNECGAVCPPVEVDGLNARQRAAIHLLVPNSGDEELDKMIRQRLREERAQKAMWSLTSIGFNWEDDKRGMNESAAELIPSIAEVSYIMADAMETASKGE